MFGVSLGWLSAIMIFLVVIRNYWVSPNQVITVFKIGVRYLYGEFKSLTDSRFPPGGILLPLRLFLSIIFINFTGLVPYFFTSSRHMRCSLSLALRLWVGHVFIAWLSVSEKIFAHLIPAGTPTALIPFMVLIELIRSVIRPLTLRVRLAANMIAGHLLITLLRNQLSPLIPVWAYGIIFALVLLVILETAVAIIQSYVFRVLSALYLTEVRNPQMSSYNKQEKKIE